MWEKTPFLDHLCIRKPDDKLVFTDWSGCPSPSLSSMSVDKLFLNILTGCLPSSNSNDSSALFFPSHPRIYIFLDEKEALILNLSCTQFRPIIPRDALLTVICHMPMNSTNFTVKSSTVLSKMVEQSTNFTCNPRLICTRTRLSIMGFGGFVTLGRFRNVMIPFLFPPLLFYLLLWILLPLPLRIRGLFLGLLLYCFFSCWWILVGMLPGEVTATPSPLSPGTKSRTRCTKVSAMVATPIHPDRNRRSRLGSNGSSK